MNANALTQQLRGFTLLLSLEFSVDLMSGTCIMTMNLTQTEARGAKTIFAEFSGVSNLRIEGFGGGITQLLLLEVKDIRYKQLDRLSYEIRELEANAISFMCRSAAITEIEPS